MSLLSVNAPLTPDLDLRHPGRLGLIGIVLLVGILGGWAASTVIGGAVVASGRAVVHGNPVVVQSLDGGEVARILVTDGDVVEEGQVLLQFDATLLQANLDIAQRQLAAALALRSRLQAEQAGLPEVRFSYPALPFPLPDTAVEEAAERQIFAARAAVLAGGREQLAESERQFDNQTTGLEGQIEAVNEQLVLLDRDLDNMRTLTAQGLARQSQMSDLQSRRAALIGQLAGLQSDLARLGNARRDAELATLQSERGFLEDVVTQMREATSQIEALILEIVTHRAALDRVDVRAPATGVVHELKVSTPGAVIAPGGTVLDVIPLGRGMDFELQVDPRAIDQVHPGQTAQLVLASFDPQTTPRLTAQVGTISADAILDERSGQRYYRVGLAISPEELGRLGNLALVPGMPVEAYLETGDRTVLAYLLHPISSHLRRAFRE